jgi:hypothetical protein
VSSVAALGALALFGGCAQTPPDSPPEDASAWYEPATTTQVDEPVPFTATNYDFDGGIAALNAGIFPVAANTIAYGPGEAFPTGSSCLSTNTPNLPDQITGIVTILPRLYVKIKDCGGDAEKYYTSYFLQDSTGGVFVLGDGKAEHFESGNRITINVRSGRTDYTMNEIYSWDLADVSDTVEPIYYTVRSGSEDGPLDGSDVSLVRRVEGVVRTVPDTFGAFTIVSDSGITYNISIDSELARRGVTYSVGQRLQVTGPVFYSFSIYAVIVMREGQVSVLD